jgi:hypothetical protein
MSGTVTDQTPMTRSRVRARLATTMISVGINITDSITIGSPVQRASMENEREN